MVLELCVEFNFVSQEFYTFISSGKSVQIFGKVTRLYFWQRECWEGRHFL